MLRALVILMLLVAGLDLAEARADTPKVALIDVSTRATSEWRMGDAQLLDSMAAGLARDGKLQVMPAAGLQTFFREPPDARAEALSIKARDQLAAGRTYSTRLKPDKAIEEFSGALRNLRAIFPHLADLTDLEEAHLQRGMTYQALGKDEDAGREYRMVLLLDPARKLDEAVVNPVVIERFEQVRSDLVTSMKGSVSLLSRPNGARVLMNGRPVGHTPITIPGVLPGEHYFSMHLAGYRTWFGVLSAPAGGVEKQEVFLSEGKSIARVRLLRQALGSAAAAEQLARGLGVDWLVLASLSHPGGQSLAKLTAYSHADQLQSLGIFRLDDERLPALIQRLARLLGGDATAFARMDPDPDPIGPGPRPPPPVEKSGAWYSQWWFWTAVGVVVAGAAATTTVLMLDGDQGVQVDVYR